MENKDTLQDSRKALKSASLPTFVEKGDERGIEDMILDVLEEILSNPKAKPSEKLEASWLFMKYKYGNPPNKTDVTSGGHPINTVSFDILENDSNTGEQG
jgi:hypothetical protein